MKLHKNKEIALRQKTKHLKKIPKILEYNPFITGKIRNRSDLIKVINTPDFECHCEKCKKGIPKEEKKYNKGLCFDCSSLIVKEKRCFICFEKIITEYFDYMDICVSCEIKMTTPEGSNSHGYKEGGKLSGELRQNYWIDNQNDDISKIYEGE